MDVLFAGYALAPASAAPLSRGVADGIRCLLLRRLSWRVRQQAGSYSGTACIQRVRVQSSGLACQWDGVHSAGLHSIERACIEFVGAGLLAKAACQAMTMSGRPTSSRASALLQWKCVHSMGPVSAEKACTPFVGAGLLAKAVCQARTMSGGSTSSRASALLQWLCVHSDRVAAFACSGTQTKSGHKKTPCHRVGRRSVRASRQPNSQ
jgi:hypothetical protein